MNPLATASPARRCKSAGTRALLLVLTLVAARCSGQAYEEGQRAYEARDFTRAMDLWLPAAESGDTRSQYAIGHLYDKGLGLPGPDWEEASRWYRQAGEQGHVDAQYNLATLYHTPREDWPQDLVRAAAWYMKAAELGKPEAQYMVGQMYYTGVGLPRNATLAVPWLTRCAEQQHNGKCMNLLGVLYRDGQGVPADVARGLGLICQAAELGETDAQLNLARSRAQGVGVAQDAVEAARWREIAKAQSPQPVRDVEDWEAAMSEEVLERGRGLAAQWKPAASVEEAAARCVGHQPG